MKKKLLFVQKVPFDDSRGIVPNAGVGRVLNKQGLYCTGWIATGEGLNEIGLAFVELFLEPRAVYGITLPDLFLVMMIMKAVVDQVGNCLTNQTDQPFSRIVLQHF